MVQFNFHGQHVIVNGGNTGIGRAIVLAFARAGADVSFVYFGGDEAKHEANETRRAAESSGAQIHEEEVDSSQSKDIHTVIHNWITIRQRLDALVNVAGITRDAKVWNMNAEDWSRVMEVNAGSYFNCIHAVAPTFRNQKHGRIINITSINGMRGKIGQANYAASKAAVIALTKTVARELGPSNVTVNAVAPGFIATHMTEKLPEEIRSKAISETVLGRAGTVEDVAHAVLFLASEGARHITGTVLQVDGGQYM